VRKHTDAAAIGAFVIGAIALGVAAILTFGSGRLFRETEKFVCYFDNSVEGLEVGAPVKARGVAIGRVVHIQLQYRQRLEDKRIPVFIEIDLKRLTSLGGERPSPSMYDELIARGLRARLESQSLVTGALFVEINWFPLSPVKLSEIDPKGGVPEIPTVPTKLAEIGASVTAILAKVGQIDFAALARSITEAASSVDRLASSPKVPEALAEVTAAASAFEKLGRDTNADLRPLLGDLRLTVGDARSAVVGLNGAAGAASRLVAPEAPLSVRLGEALGQVSRAADAVRDLAEYLQRNPNSLLVGKAR
jgi:paraquat-inducible protein B